MKGLTLFIWSDSEPTNLGDHLKQKPKMGDKQLNASRKVPLQVYFLADDILLWCLFSYLIHDYNWQNFNVISDQFHTQENLVIFRYRHVKQNVQIQSKQ